MRFSVVTIFPDIVNAYISCSILKRAVQAGLVAVSVYNLRDYTFDKHKMVDDYPYGGGSGMVMKPEPFFRITEAHWPDKEQRKIIMLTPKGRPFSQSTALELSKEEKEIVLFCGRYEAIDERVREFLVDDEISTGDYILTGGELPALVIIDAVSRLIPGVLGDSRSTVEESFTWGLLDYPQFTRPEDFQGMQVPGVLLSGNHNEITRWRKKEALKVTMERRPDLIEQYRFTEEEEKIVKEIKEEQQ